MALIDEWSGCLPLPSLTDSKFHNYSTTANLVASYDHFPSPEKELLNHSQRTMPELPKQETIVTGKAEREISDIAIRFKSIQRIFIQHSTRQSSAHESRLDLKRMDLDWTQLSSDLANKMSIAQDLKALVEKLEENPTEQTQQMVESKFQEYYLERHYGGLTCDIHDLNIEQRQSSKCLRSNSIELQNPISSLSKCNQSEQSIQYINLNLRPESKAALSNLGCVSLVNQSNYSQGNYHSVTIQVPRIIEIQIPIIVYKLKERKVGLEESQLGGLGGDLDEIIDRFSKPYEQLYFGWKDQQKGESGLMMQTRTQKDMTEVELSYSQFPGENLPLDSYAQIGSLISNPEVSRVANHELPISTIIITEKLNSKSVLQKFQQAQRALIDENAELKETITHLQQSIAHYQQKLIDIEKKSEKLSNRLEQQILYGQCLQRQIQKFNLESYQQKIENITKLQTETSKRNETLTRQLDTKILELEMAKNELQQLRIVGEKTEQLLSQRQEELSMLSKQLQEQQEQIYRLDNCEQDMKQFASSSEINLKHEIQRLETEKGQLILQLSDLKRRIEQDGLSLDYQQAKEIQGIIEERQHLFKIEMREIEEKYVEIANSYKKQAQNLQKSKVQLEARIQKQKQERQKEKTRFNRYFKDFEVIIQEYHRELQLKDSQMLEMKQQKLHFENKFGSIDHQQNLTVTLYKTVQLLKEELQKEHQQRQKILQTMISLQKTMNLSHNDSILHQLQLATNLVEQLSHKLETQTAQNLSLTHRLTHQAHSFSEKQKLQKQASSLRKANSKLKRYTKQLQNEMIAISGMSRCESHSTIIKLVCEERDYYRDLHAL